MKNRYLNALITSSLSILPIIIIIYILSLTKIAPIGNENHLLLAVGAIALILGLTLFQIGASKSLTKVGEYMGSSLSKQTNVWIIIIFAFLLGALITCAEPSILIVSGQVGINKWLLVGSIAGGVGLFVVIGVVRIIYQKSLKLWYVLFYLIVFGLICLLQADPNNHKFLPFIFDSGGITTGSATVPFILALGAGVATVRGGKNSRDSSFGLVGVASIGPILTMTILIMVSPAGFEPYAIASSDTLTIFQRFLNALLPSSDFSSLGTFIEVLMALLPIIIIFFVYNFIYMKLSKQKIWQLIIGFIISYIGLVIFLSGVGAAMSPIGQLVGQKIAEQKDWVIILLAFILGMVTILCEPAVHVLTTQIENISDGQLKKKTVLLTLSIGVGIAICLSTIRTLFSFSIMYIVVPGYIISLILAFFVPDIYTAIAFDSGGTASGPMSVSFILPMIIGIYSVREGLGNEASVLYYENAFGCIALIALTPIIAIQLLGLTSEIKQIQSLRAMREQVYDIRNNEIIHFK